jgi:hypothetical protein
VLEHQELRPVENRKIEKGQVIAELFALELAMLERGVTLKAAMNHEVPLPRLLLDTLEACKRA